MSFGEDGLCVCVRVCVFLVISSIIRCLYEEEKNLSTALSAGGTRHVVSPVFKEMVVML